MSVSKEFEENLPGGGGSLTASCSCGRFHFASGFGAGDYDEGELERYRSAVVKDPKHNIEDGTSDAIGTYVIAGNVLVWDCPCGQFEQMEEFIICNQGWILKFLRARNRRIRREADDALELMEEIPF